MKTVRIVKVKDEDAELGFRWDIFFGKSKTTEFHAGCFMPIEEIVSHWEGQGAKVTVEGNNP